MILFIEVSIQPKPKKGLVDPKWFQQECEKHTGFNPAEAEEGFSSRYEEVKCWLNMSFNPAEAEEGFSSSYQWSYSENKYSFNPAEAEEGFSRNLLVRLQLPAHKCFNPAEAEEGFSRLFRINVLCVFVLFQSSRSRRRV